MGKHGALHKVGGHGQGDRVDKREATRHRQGSSFPTGELSTDLVDNGIKGSLVSTISDDGDTKVSPKLIRTVHAQLVFNGDDILGTGVGRKEEF